MNAIVDAMSLYNQLYASPLHIDGKCQRFFPDLNDL